MEAPRLSDQALFESLNLDHPGLGKVKAAVERGDMEAAKHELIAHIKRRETPRWRFDWRSRPQQRDASFDTSEAERYARNELVSVGVWHEFGDSIDWSINPMPNQYAEWTWQLSRHGAWVTLGRAYWATGDEKYAKAFVFQMNSWVTQNPVPDDSGNYRGSRWRTIEAGIRTGQTWFPCLYYFLSSPNFDDQSIIKMIRLFIEHARHLMRWPQTGNWLTMEANGLYHIGVMLPEFKEAETWRNTAMQRLYDELENQVYPDGAQIELSSGYHQVSLRNFVMPIQLAQLNNQPIPSDYLSRLEKMYHYNLYAAMPNGQLPALNDGGWTNIHGYCKEGAAFFPHRNDLLWMATDGAEGTRPTHNSYLFPYAGHFVMRSGWDKADRYMLFDGGPFGYGHQHEDKLHFVIYAYGRVHVTDPGNYPYDNSQWRRYHIGAWAHNTIIVDGLPQNRRGSDRKLYVVKSPIQTGWISNADYDYAAAAYNDPNEPLPIAEGYGADRLTNVTHTRQIVFVKPDYWVIFDTLQPHDDATHTYESPFHLEAEAADLNRSTGVVTTKNIGDSNLAIIPLWREGLSVEIVSGQEAPVVQGWVREGEYGVRPIPTPTYRQAVKGTAHFVYVFYPIPKGLDCPVRNVEPIDREDGLGIRIEFANEAVHTVAVSTDKTKPPIVNRKMA